MSKFFKSAIVALIVAFAGSNAAQAAVMFAFEANSAGTKPLFELDGNALSASNTIDLFIDITDGGGASATYDDALFEFEATRTGSTVIPGFGEVVSFSNVTFSFKTAGLVDIVSGAYGSATMFIGINQTSTAITISSTDGDIYTAGPELTALLATVALPMEEVLLADNQDFAFALSGRVATANGWTANSSYVGTSDTVTRIIPLPGTAMAGLALLGIVAAGNVFRRRRA